MSDQPEPARHGDEVRLVDLLATVIRRRRWVVWTTVVGTGATLLVLFLLPLLGVWLVGGAPGYLVQATVRASQLPTEVKDLLGVDYQVLVGVEASDLALLGDVYKDTLLSSEAALADKPQLNRLVKAFATKTLKVISDPKLGTFTFSLRSDASSQDKTLLFMNRFVARLRQGVKEAAFRAFQNAPTDVPSSPTGSKAVLTKFDLSVQLIFLRALFANPDYPISMAGSVTLLEEEPAFSRSLLVVLAVLGSVLAGLLLAFGAESVARARRDPATMELLKKAWSRQ